MVTRRDFLKKGGLAIAGLALGGSSLKTVLAAPKVKRGMEYVCLRPRPEERHFTSKAVEEVIAKVKKQLKILN